MDKIARGIMLILVVATISTSCDFVKKKTGIDLPFSSPSITPDSLNLCIDEYRKGVEALESLADVVTKHGDIEFAHQESDSLRIDIAASAAIINEHESDLSDEQKTLKEELDRKNAAAEQIISEALVKK